MKRRILAANFVMFFLLLLLPLHADTEKVPEEKKATKPVVVLTIDYGDGAQKRFPEIPWRKAMTVHDALSWADEHPRGIDFVSRGKGQTALITKIDDLQNSGGRAKNWVYRVNNKLGEKSCAVFSIKAGDRILWRFERYK